MAVQEYGVQNVKTVKKVENGNASHNLKVMKMNVNASLGVQMDDILGLVHGIKVSGFGRVFILFKRKADG
jgi:hypothetical protein